MEVDSAAEVAAAKPLTPEEEALRRSTDCVYFLASPLTCKKVRRASFLGFRPSGCCFRRLRRVIFPPFEAAGLVWE